MKMPWMFFLCLLSLAMPLKAEPIWGLSKPPAQSGVQAALTGEIAQELGIAHVRISENWKHREEVGSFTPLRTRLRALRASGLKVLLTVEADAPAKHCAHATASGCYIKDDEAFARYINVLLRATRNDIDAIQFGTDWDGDKPEEFLHMYRVFSHEARKSAPKLPLVLGGVSGQGALAVAVCKKGVDPLSAQHSVEAFCKGDGAAAANQKSLETVFRVMSRADYDIAAVHLRDMPGAWPSVVSWVQNHARGRPVWSTAFGGEAASPGTDSAQAQAERLALYLDVMRQLPVERAYFDRVSNDPASDLYASGLLAANGQEKPVWLVFKAR